MPDELHVDDNPPGIAGIEADPAGRDEPHGLGQERVLETTQALENVLGLPRIGKLDCPLQDDRAGIDALVDEVDGDPEYPHAVLERLLDGSEPGKGGQKSRVDVGDPTRKTAEELPAQELHVAREHDELNPPLAQP